MSTERHDALDHSEIFGGPDGFYFKVYGLGTDYDLAGPFEDRDDAEFALHRAWEIGGES